jgi:hypothetical protein
MNTHNNQVHIQPLLNQPQQHEPQQQHNEPNLFIQNNDWSNNPMTNHNINQQVAQHRK